MRMPGLRSDGGFGLIEVTMATGILAVAVAGLVGGMTMSLGVAGVARQRSAASALGAERIERGRNLAYDQVALLDQPVYSSDPADPDHDVSADGTRYLVNSVLEPLIVSPASGAIRHIEDPVLRGSTELYVHQYVTGVDDDLDGVIDYKRLTVVVTWRRAMRRAVSARITLTTFVGTRSVSVPATTPVPLSPMSSPSPAPTSSPAPCAGDVTPPSGSQSIQAGAGAEAGYVNSPSVQVNLLATDDCPSLFAELSNDNSAFSNVTSLVSGITSTVAWSVPAGDGPKTVYTRFRDGAGNVSPVLRSTVVLDRTPPTVPQALAQASCTLSGSNRIVSLTWSTSSDANLSGYRLYRSVDSGPFVSVVTTSSASASDTSRKSSDSVRYLVRAYDKAGWESADSTVKTYAKNAC